jgi:hypothetical protein
LAFSHPEIEKSFTTLVSKTEFSKTVSTLIPVLTAYEKEHLGERQPLPERYLSLTDEEMDRRILAARRTLGCRLVILGHHYQRDEVIKFADYTGDSSRSPVR